MLKSKKLLLFLAIILLQTNVQAGSFVDQLTQLVKGLSRRQVLTGSAAVFAVGTLGLILYKLKTRKKKDSNEKWAEELMKAIASRLDDGQLATIVHYPNKPTKDALPNVIYRAVELITKPLAKPIRHFEGEPNYLNPDHPVIEGQCDEKTKWDDLNKKRQVFNQDDLFDAARREQAFGNVKDADSKESSESKDGAKSDQKDSSEDAGCADSKVSKKSEGDEKGQEDSFDVPGHDVLQDPNSENHVIVQQKPENGNRARRVHKNQFKFKPKPRNGKRR